MVVLVATTVLYYLQTCLNDLIKNSKMNTENKENIASADPSKSKIPLPQKPLPPVPPRLTCFSAQDAKKIQRHPLKTLNNQEQASTSVFDNNKVNKQLNFRQNDPAIEWEYKVFRDKFESIKIREDVNDCVIVDEEHDVKDDETAVACKKNSDGVLECEILKLNETLRPKTPAAVLEPIRIRNIKRSLKRPHSREMQGLTPVKKNEVILENKPKPNVRCSIVERLEKPDHLTKQYVHSHSYSKEVFSYLLRSEKKPSGNSTLNEVTRACIINWIMKINGEDGDPGTVQIACWYLDSIASVRVLRLEFLPVIAAACYWIAQKLKGPQLSAHRLVKNGGHAYSSHVLLEAEKNILTALDFPAQPIVPHDFTTYLSWWVDPKDPGPLEVASSFIVLCGILINKELSMQYASVLGCAAIYNAIRLLGKNNLIPRFLSCPIYLQAEKKCKNFPAICKELRQAVVILGLPCNEYRTPYLHYSRPPHMIGKVILDAANKLETNDKSEILI